jgi:uncharacterized protein (TIGR03083 family)
VETAGHIDALEVAGAWLVAAAEQAGPDAPVPTCPGWRLRDLLAHIGFVHRWATRYVQTALSEMLDEPPEDEILRLAPPDGERVAWVADGCAALVRALCHAPPDLCCWTFLPAPSPRAMWARRQAHETAVHAADATLAAGRHPGPFDPDFAADGIDELLFAFYGRGRPSPERGDGAVGFEATDRPLAWTVRVSEGVVAAQPGLGPCDVRVRGTASDLYLLAWNRLPPTAVEIAGPAAAFERIWGGTGVTWQ